MTTRLAQGHSANAGRWSRHEGDRGRTREPYPCQDSDNGPALPCPRGDRARSGPARAAPPGPAYEHYELPCGMPRLSRAVAPGSLTGDCPDARQRAERHENQTTTRQAAADAVPADADGPAVPAAGVPAAARCCSSRPRRRRSLVRAAFQPAARPCGRPPRRAPAEKPGRRRRRSAGSGRAAARAPATMTTARGAGRRAQAPVAAAAAAGTASQDAAAEAADGAPGGPGRRAGPGRRRGGRGRAAGRAKASGRPSRSRSRRTRPGAAPPATGRTPPADAPAAEASARRQPATPRRRCRRGRRATPTARPRAAAGGGGASAAAVRPRTAPTLPAGRPAGHRGARARAERQPAGRRR